MVSRRRDLGSAEADCNRGVLDASGLGRMGTGARCAWNGPESEETVFSEPTSGLDGGEVTGDSCVQGRFSRESPGPLVELYDAVEEIESVRLRLLLPYDIW